MDFERVARIVEARGALAQLCVIHGGEVVFDRTWGVGADTPMMLFSAGKPLTAALAHRLAARGVLALDDPLARHWPAFASNGKQDITVRHVLRHRSGLPYARSLNRDALLAVSWNRSVRALERARPHTPPGEVAHYHMISHGFLLGEVARQATGETLPRLFQEIVFDPAGMTRTSLGGSRVPLRGGAAVRQALFNRRVVRDAIIPAATIASTARDLAGFYRSLLADGSWRSMTTPTSEERMDRNTGWPIRWSEGFQLGGVDGERFIGRTSDRLAFGHNGSNACMGWADPTRDLAVAYVTNRLDGGPGRSPHQCAVSDAILAAADR